MNTYTVTYERDGSGWWVASVLEISGCHTQGRTIKEARRRIREALSLFVDDAKTAELIDKVSLPERVRKAVENFEQARKDLEEAAVRSKTELDEAAHSLGEIMLLSVRDTGHILGLSHQRIQQVVTERRKSKTTKNTTSARKSGSDKKKRGRSNEDSVADEC